METTTRTVAKAVSWQAFGLIVMTAVAYAITGSVTEGGLVAVAGAVIGMATYIVHERLWARVSWGRSSTDPDTPMIQS